MGSFSNVFSLVALCLGIWVTVVRVSVGLWYLRISAAFDLNIFVSSSQSYCYLSLVLCWGKSWCGAWRVRTRCSAAWMVTSEAFIAVNLNILGENFTLFLTGSEPIFATTRCWHLKCYIVSPMYHPVVPCGVHGTIFSGLLYVTASVPGDTNYIALKSNSSNIFL